jgi:hypothetical protein
METAAWPLTHGRSIDGGLGGPQMLLYVSCRIEANGQPSPEPAQPTLAGMEAKGGGGGWQTGADGQQWSCTSKR